MGRLALILGIITLWLSTMYKLFIQGTRLQDTKLDSILFTIITALFITDAFIMPIVLIYLVITH